MTNHDLIALQLQNSNAEHVHIFFLVRDGGDVAVRKVVVEANSDPKDVLNKITSTMGLVEDLSTPNPTIPEFRQP